MIDRSKAELVWAAEGRSACVSVGHRERGGREERESAASALLLEFVSLNAARTGNRLQTDDVSRYRNASTAASTRQGIS